LVFFLGSQVGFSAEDPRVLVVVISVGFQMLIIAKISVVFDRFGARRPGT
tara:strand:+ start:93 stop:242 length:150 start_codon:yes stop_codon:yes gene_type:complete